MQSAKTNRHNFTYRKLFLRLDIYFTEAFSEEEKLLARHVYFHHDMYLFHENYIVAYNY